MRLERGGRARSDHLTSCCVLEGFLRFFFSTPCPRLTSHLAAFQAFQAPLIPGISRGLPLSSIPELNPLRPLHLAPIAQSSWLFTISHIHIL
jgi:hypothetical protein